MSVMEEPGYRSGDDVVLEFVHHRYAFSADDFRERVSAAAVRLGLVEAAELDAESEADLAEIAASGSLGAPRSSLGRYLVAGWEQIAWHEGHSLVYWLRKLVFRGAWLDERVKRGLLDVTFDEASGDFRFQLPNAERPLVEVAGYPSWRPVRYPGG
jgi:hypothetical protein